MIKILATEEMKEIAQRVYQLLKAKDSCFSYAEVDIISFTSKEFKPKITETVRHQEVYLFHSLYHPDPNSAFMKLVLTIDAISRASAKSITLVLPYMSYLRQDRKDESRVPISARLMANLIEVNRKVERILVMDMHSDQAQGFYNIPLDNLYGALVHKDYFEKMYKKDFTNVVVVSPDHGGVVRARRFAKYLDREMSIGIVDKRRSGSRSNKVETLHYLGPEIKEKEVILYDDMIDTGGSIIAAAAMLLAKGAKKVYACATHGVFSAPSEKITAEERLRTARIKVVVTNSIPRTKEYTKKNQDWLTILPIENLLANAVHESSKVGGSVSILFGGAK